MSGGRWNYQQWRIGDIAEDITNGRDQMTEFIKAVAQSERIVDWAESGDTVRRREDGSGAERDLYDLWLSTFDRVYGDGLRVAVGLHQAGPARRLRPRRGLG